MAIDYIDTTDKNEDRSDRLTLSHDAFMAHVAQCPQEDQERMNWLWGYLHNVLNRSKSRLIAELGQEWEDIRRYLAGGLPDYKYTDMVESGIIYPQEGDARDYEHNFVVREVLTEDLFGDPLASVGDEEIIEYSLEADLPRSVLVPENTSVIIAVSRPRIGDPEGSLEYPNVTYLDLEIYDNAVIVPANGSVDLAYEE